jgi:hypothetical protein
VFRSLESSFEAALAHEDELAANDLALSLLQGRSMRASAARSGSLRVLTDGSAPIPVELIGEDFFASASNGLRLWPLATAIVRSEPGPRPEPVDVRLIEVLRRGLRGGLADCELTCVHRVVRGRLTLVGPDYIAVDEARGRTFVPVVRLTRILFPDAGPEGVF